MRRTRKYKNLPPTILILSEDTCSVADYLSKIFKHRCDKINIVVKGIGKEPKTLIQQAKKALAADQRMHGQNDFVFLCFDRDNRADFDNCIREIAEMPSVVAIASSQCFEYFWQLHYEASSRSLPAREMPTYLKKFEGFERYDKSIGSVPIIKLAELQEVAIANCAKVRKEYRLSGGNCPFSDMDLLIEYIDKTKALGICALSDIKKDKRFYHPSRN